jgi:dipeptidyl aminopeptidase/acylaminoacyl peptidase
MRRARFVLCALLMLTVGCKRCGASGGGNAQSLADARRGFITNIVRTEARRHAVASPPPRLFRIEEYAAPVGKLASYITVAPTDTNRHPAVVWLTGGDSNSLDEVWGPVDEANDQTAREFRDAGIVLMFPQLRGGNLSKTRKESFFGEVDDVLAAAAHLATLPYVDSGHIYLGGHSTGGTLALLTAEVHNPFRTVFAFGPVDDVSGYQGEYLTCAMTDAELRLRSPIHWLAGIATPTFVFEGDTEGNSLSLLELQKRNTNPLVQFELVKGKTHFTILAPYTKRLARSIVADVGTGAFTVLP